MTNIDLPSAEIIKKFNRSGPRKAEIVKNGQLVTSRVQDKPYSMWMDITPAMASDWLKNNFRNRPVKEDTVKAYARDMLNGQWVATHQGLAFNKDDELIDGQHRLMAIVLSKVAVRMMVTFGLPSKIEGREMTTMDCVDRGATRSVADQLVIQHGFKYGSLTASICAALSSICCGERTRRLSVGQTLEVYRVFEEPVNFVINNRSKSPGLRSAGVLAAFTFALPVLSDAKRMLTFLNGENGNDKFPVVKLLRAFLTSDEAKLISRSLDRGLAEMTLQVLFLEHHERSVEKLELSLEGADWFRSKQKESVQRIAGIFQLPKVEAEHQAKAASATAPVKKNLCDCGKKYEGQKHMDGCPDCRAAYLVHEKRAGRKLRPHSEEAFGEIA